MIILRSAGLYTRIAHLIRSIEGRLWTNEQLERLDSFTFKEIERILSSPLSVENKAQITTPITFGGLGLQSASDKAKSSHTFISARTRIYNASKRLAGFDDITFPAPENKLSVPNGAQLVTNTLSQSTDIVKQAFYLASKDAHSGAFLTAKPYGSTELSDDHFATAVRLRLGLDQISNGCHCTTHEIELDTRGRHALSCQNWQGLVHRRHDLLRDTIFKICSKIDRDAEIDSVLSEGDCNPIAASNFRELPIQVTMEERADSTLIPGDVAVRLSSSDTGRTFYDVSRQHLDRRRHPKRPVKQNSRGQNCASTGGSLQEKSSEAL